MNEKPSVQPGRYRHYKGNEYIVIGTARHSETLEELVVYRQEYGDHGLWVRPKQMFSQMVEVEGQEVPRFETWGRVGDGDAASIPKRHFEELFQAILCTPPPHRVDRLPRPSIVRRSLATSMQCRHHSKSDC
jgi:hypothetical protein